MQTQPCAAAVDESTLIGLAGALLATIDGARHVSIALTADEILTTVVSTDPAIEPVGSPCEGPALATMLTGRITRVPTVQRCSEFPEFVAHCRLHRVASAACFPIKDAALRTVGTLTVSSEDHHGFSAADLRYGRSSAELIAAELRKPRRPTLAAG